MERLKREIEQKKAEVQEGWKRIEELEKETPEPLPRPEERKRLEDKSGTSPLKKVMIKMGFKKGESKEEGGDWTRVKSNID